MFRHFLIVMLVGMTQAINYLELKVPEPSSSQLTCPDGKVIEIVLAGFRSATSCPYFLSEIELQRLRTVPDASYFIMPECWRMTSCTLHATQTIFHAPCMGLNGPYHIYVRYYCAASDTHIKQGRACERRHLQLSCPDGGVLEIHSAVYGRKSKYFCRPEESTTTCEAAEALSIVKDRCEGKSSCTVEATNDVFGDPCRGVYKYLQVYHSCAFDECASNPCLNGATCMDNGRSYSCTCTLGWEGVNCGTAIDKCASYPCLNDAVCRNNSVGYSCTCNPGWEGVNCEIASLACHTFSEESSRKVVYSGDNIVQEVYYPSTTATFSCNDDVMLIGDSTATCSAGKWSGEGHCAKNIALEKTASQESYLFAPLPAPRAVDGNRSTVIGNCANKTRDDMEPLRPDAILLPSFLSSNIEWLTVDLGGTFEIGSIHLYLTNDSFCATRISDFRGLTIRNGHTYERVSFPSDVVLVNPIVLPVDMVVGTHVSFHYPFFGQQVNVCELEVYGIPKMAVKNDVPMNANFTYE